MQVASNEILPPLAEDDKMLSGLAYPGWIIFPAFILLSSKKEDSFVCFHAIQGLAFGILSSVATMLVTLGVWLLFQVLPSAGGTGSGLLGVGLFASIFVFLSILFIASIFIGWQASSGRFLKLPVIGEWAENKMVEMLDLDLEATKRAAMPRPLAAAAPAAPLEPIPFPERQQNEPSRGIDPGMAANYARQLLQNQPPQASAPRPPAPPPPQRPAAPPPPIPKSALPSAFQKNPRPSQPAPPAAPPLRAKNLDDTQSAGRWLSSRPGDGPGRT